ncbi:MAG: molybdate ABC transporter substrate-binding protein [Methylophilaceae bacterium]|nr:molybdate ABC transporter substrate-binding protein [Methylophilaceae bacterium]
MRIPVHIIISALAFLMTSFSTIVVAEPIKLAAASDLKFAVEELAAEYTKKTGHNISLTFGSSGLLATQIRHGAPFQLFMSADESYVADLQAAGTTLDAGVLYAIGRIVLIAPKSSKLPLDENLNGLKTLLAQNKLNKFAIANPEHAPYGKRAEEALRHLGLWSSIQPHLVLGENVSQAAQFATSGSADGGIVALSLVKTPHMQSRVNYALLPEILHAPLKQRMVLTKNAGEVAKDFYGYLQQPAARQVFIKYGFELPEAR